MRKRFLALAAAILFLFTAGCATNNAATPPNSGDLAGKLIILHTNDVHGHAAEDPATGAIGYAAVSQLKKDLISLGASVLLLDAGDASQGMPLANLSYGKQIFEFMNLAGYDAMAPGNHDFDWGSDNMLQNKEVAKFPILAANIVRKTGRDLVFDANKIFEMPNGMKVGVFGLDTPETLTKTNPDKIKDIDFLRGQDLYTCAQAQIDELKQKGATLIVCLGHMGVDAESEPNRSTDVINNTNGIDLFIDGHSHVRYEAGEKVGSTLVVSTGSALQCVGVVKVESAAQMTASLYTGKDKAVDDYIKTIAASVNEELSAVFAKTEVDLNGERDPGVRTMETNLGDFAADALLWAAKQAVGDQVAAAITNGGGIRTSVKAGDITMNDMKTIFPFGNEVAVLTVKGSELLEALEAATFSTPTAVGAFPQVAGIEFTIDTKVPYENGEAYPDSTYFKPAKPGSRVTITKINGEAFDLQKDYTIATNDFTAVGGDTYYAFKYPYTQTGYKTGLSLEDAMSNFVKSLNGTIGKDYSAPKGRITILK